MADFDDGLEGVLGSETPEEVNFYIGPEFLL